MTVVKHDSLSFCYFLIISNLSSRISSYYDYIRGKSSS